MELVAEVRAVRGKANKALRKQGLIPAELYGHGFENMSLAVDAKAFQKVFGAAGESTVVQLVVGGETRPVLIHDVARDYLTEAVSHVDFYQVRMDEKIKAGVRLAFAGEAPAVKAHGGLLNKVMSEIEVEGLPGDLPHEIVVDLSGLAELNQSIYVKDLAVSPKVRVLVEPETVVATVTPPAKEEEIAPPPADVSAVKVETEEKKEERDKGKEKEKPEETKSV